MNDDELTEHLHDLVIEILRQLRWVFILAIFMSCGYGVIIGWLMWG